MEMLIHKEALRLNNYEESNIMDFVPTPVVS